jgi:hypothetical protein
MIVAQPLPRARIPAIPVRVVEDGDGPDLLEASLALAHTQLVGQLADETSLDARTMGTLGFTGALLAADIAARDLLGAAWWTPLIAIGLATACCLGPALGVGFGLFRHTDLGPNASAFYTTYGDKPSRAAREQMLTDLAAAYARNARQVRAKQHALRTSLMILVIGLLVSATAVATEQPSTIKTAHAHQRTPA